MTVPMFSKHWLTMSRIEAENQLRAFQVADWPKMKKESRQELHRQLHSRAYPITKKDTSKVATQDDINRILGVR